MKALVTGGYFDQGGDGVILLVDLESEQVDVLLRWQPPKHLLVPTKGFAGGSISEDGMVYVAAHAAVVRVDPARAVVTGVLHQPCMNDLHHVAALDDRLYVVNTGLSAVDMFSHEGDFLGSYSLLPGWVNARRIGGEDFSPTIPPVSPGWSGAPPTPWSHTQQDDGYHDVDRRSAPFHRLKIPDYLHVNHVAQVGDKVLATCFADGSIRDLRNLSEVARLEGQFLHDGVAFGTSFWLTTIDGSIVEFDCKTFVERRRFRVFPTGHYGWCRGLAVTSDHLMVGLTRLVKRPPQPWTNLEPAGSETSVLLLDVRDGRLLARIDLTDTVRNSKIYSILPIEDL